MKKLLALFSVAFISAVVTADMFHKNKVVQIKNEIALDEAVLTCFIDNRDKVITADKIVDIDFDSMHYFFSNGSAKNCEFYRK